MLLGNAHTPTLAFQLFGSDPSRVLMVLRAAWPHAVGSGVAARSEPIVFEKGTLRVRVHDGGWRKTLHRMQPDILMRLRRIVGELAPRRLAFVESPVDGHPIVLPATVPLETRSCASEWLQRQAEVIPDLDLRALFLRSASRYLARFEE